MIIKGTPCNLYIIIFHLFKQCEDNLPVYLKCGTRDKVVYWIIVAFTVYCTIQSFKGIKVLLEKYSQNYKKLIAIKKI